MTAQGKAALLELRDRLAKATGPDRLADRAIAETVLGRKLKIIEVPKGHPVFQEGGGLEFMEAISGWTGIPPYTASLDSAVTLVPEGWRARNMQQADPSLKHMLAGVELIPLNVNDAGWVVRAAAGGYRAGIHGTHPTSLPLALCLARLEYELAKEGQP